jgi:riboflavin transporter FmnP
MKPNVMLMIASLLSIILMIFHMTDDIVRGMEPGTRFDLIIVPVLAVWLYGTLVLRDRRSGSIIVLVAAVLGLLIPIIHMKGAGVGGAIAKSSGGFFFIWTLIALGVTSLFSVMLSARALWEQLRGRTG